MSKFDIRFYLAIFITRFWSFILVTSVVSAIGFATAYFMPAVYRAYAQILVESPQISTDLVRSTVSEAVIKQLQLIELQLMTRANLVALAERFKLYEGQTKRSPDDIADEIRSKTKIEPIQLNSPRTEGAAAFSVSFTDRDPFVAADVVNELVRLILQKNVRIRTGQANDTLQFFQQESERLGTELNDLERRLLKFKNDNGDALPESLSFRRNQQLNQEERLLQLEREETSLRDARSKLAQAALSTGGGLGAAATPKEQTLEQLRRVLIEQRAMYSDKSPGIVALQARIATLEKEIQTEKSGGPDSAIGKRRPSETEIRIAEISQRLSSISQEKNAIQEALARLTQSIASTPGNESTLNALERERQRIQTQLNIVTTRLAEASTGQQIELLSKGERLSLLEPATPPRASVGPKRRWIAVGGLAAGIVAGLGTIVLLEILNGSIRRPAELVRKLEIEPLVTIPYIQNDHSASSWTSSLASVFLTALILIPILLVAAIYNWPSIDVLLEKIVTSYGSNHLI